MSEYDDETGLVLSDEDEIAREAALNDDEPMDDSPHVGEDGAEGSEKEKTEKTQIVPRINKKLILLVAGALASVFVVVSIMRPDSKKKVDDDSAEASELNVPDFSVPARVYEKEEPKQAEPATPVERPVYVQPKTESKPQASSGKATRIADSDMEANNSALIPTIQGRLMGQQSAPMGYITPGSAEGAYYQASSMGGTPMNQDEYTASRLASLGDLVGSGSSGTAQNSGGASYQEQNMQGNKQSFYSSGREDEATGQFIGTDTLWSGSMIPGVLITGINTDLPGDIQARVTENIYDSLTGRKLLVPQGSILIASYNSSVSFAQSRVQIAWNTLIRPDGYQVSLGNMTGVDAQGYSGTKGKVDEHLFQYVKAAGIISAFTIVNGEFAASMATTTNTTAQNLIAANQNVANQLGANIIERTLNIQPTLTVKSGTKINIMLNKNVYLPPIDPPPVKTAYKR